MTEPAPLLRLNSNSGPVVRHGEPIVIGVPLARGSMPAGHTVALTREDDTAVPCDVHVLDRWGDGSARWALLAFRAKTNKPESVFRFAVKPQTARPNNDQSGITVTPNGEGLQIDTGAGSFAVAPGSRWPLQEVLLEGGKRIINERKSGLDIVLPKGKTPICRIDRISIEYQGRIRTVVSASGSAQVSGKRRIEVDWILEFFAGLPAVLIHTTIRNPHRARHPGGYWELGDPGSQLIKCIDFTLSLEPDCLSGIHCSPEPAKPFQSTPFPFEIYQDSSGGENYRSHNHLNREGRVPVSFRGYRSTIGEGLRASPIISAATIQGRQISVALRNFWQNFPKSFEVSPTGIKLGLFPSQWNDLYELQGGEQKTHTFVISFGLDGVTEEPLAWFRQPIIPSIETSWIAMTQAVPYLMTAADDPNTKYKELVNQAIAGSNSFENKREIIDEYGWRNFGDLYADHEAVFAKEYKGSQPLVSHYNNQYDAIAGFCYQWLRSGDHRWWTQFNELAAHVVDIDIYHTQEDKTAYNNGLFWHTFHYVDAGLSTHRSYPQIGNSNGGGPSNEHVYTTGLMLHYFLTGNIQSRKAAIDLGTFIIDIDDGTKTIFRWLSRQYTGLASASRTADYHGPGRGPGNALNALLDAYRLTACSQYHDKAEQLIRRVSHPTQNIDALNLLDAENRWFYTMFLQSLAKYLDCKIELGQMDHMHSYGRTVLLHFARWMADNEYPFLEKPELLEYPTETWAAQDMRKSDIFASAWIHCVPDDKTMLAQRAICFFSRTVDTLSEMHTKHLCRPLVLMLSYGWAQSWFKGNMNAYNPVPPSYSSTFSPQERFIPQKKVFVKRAIVLLASVFILILTSVLLFPIICWDFNK